MDIFIGVVVALVAVWVLVSIHNSERAINKFWEEIDSEISKELQGLHEPSNKV